MRDNAAQRELGHWSENPVAHVVAALNEDPHVALPKPIRTALQSYADGDEVAVPF